MGLNLVCTDPPLPWRGGVVASLRSKDGLGLEYVVTDGFGVINSGIAKFTVYKNNLYASTWSEPNGNLAHQRRYPLGVVCG